MLLPHMLTFECNLFIFCFPWGLNYLSRLTWAYHSMETAAIKKTLRMCSVSMLPSCSSNWQIPFLAAHEKVSWWPQPHGAAVCLGGCSWQAEIGLSWLCCIVLRRGVRLGGGDTSDTRAKVFFPMPEARAAPQRLLHMWDASCACGLLFMGGKSVTSKNKPTS